MDEVAVTVQQDIAIVAVFHLLHMEKTVNQSWHNNKVQLYLDEVRNDAVGGTALDEPPLRRQESL